MENQAISPMLEATAYRLHSTGDSTLIYENILAGLQLGAIPEEYPPVLDQTALKYRPEIVEASSWSMVAYDWVRPLAQWIGNRKCLEIMCGRGVLAKALRSCGKTIIATDNMSLASARWWKANAWVDDIERLDCVAAVEKYALSCGVIICSWPPADDSSLYAALLKMREVAPDALMVYIGTADPAINASREFFELAREVTDPAFMSAVGNYRQMPIADDYPKLYR